MRRIETLLMILALGFYAWFLRRLGVGNVYAYVRLAGWALALNFALEGVARVANTLGWRATIRGYPRSLSFGELFSARIAGEAVDYVTPSAQLGGQFLMALMVRHKLPMAMGLATVIVAALTEGIGQIAFIAGALLLSIRLVSSLQRLFWPIIGGLVFAVVLLLGFFAIQTRKPFSYLWKAAARFDLTKLANSEVEAAAAQADAHLADFYVHHRMRVLLSSFFYLIAWSLGVVEIYILLVFLGQPASLEIALLVDAVGLLIERATFLIPAKLVSQEGGKALIMGMLGYPPGVGFAVGFLRRLKEMAWVLLGLAALMEHRLLEEQRPKVRAGAAESRVVTD
jgi:uncharacterized protein (TIRG00374 family)